MNDVLKSLFCIFFGFSSGVVISGGVFAFIAMIGIVPRMAQKTKSVTHIPLYEDTIVIGGIIGTIITFFKFPIPSIPILTVLFSLCTGIFIGVLAVSLAEVLNVVPIFTRRLRILNGITLFILSMAIGKMIGSLLDFLFIEFL